MKAAHQALFDRLWEQYAGLAPSAHRIHALFGARGEKVDNDHIAFRTFNDPRIGIPVLATAFLEMGYVEKGSYLFPEKKLLARHYEHPEAGYPRIFISELKVEELSNKSAGLVRSFLNEINEDAIVANKLPYAGRLWGTPSYTVYRSLQEESEYAAWVYAYGFCANHFTVYTNTLQHFPSLESVNGFLVQHGFLMNQSGGTIKGTPAQLLEQSSILADRILVQFTEGQYTVPGCYYEFARRYPDANGNIYQGFIAASADKIFESTDAALAAR
ncbi:MAG: DUF1338 domain-containing protein [Sphingobacteriales bacterium]|jgi:hypothetical protein|nr:DUF1338 domain-containing protein [Sphingobacteriales bacterium]OJW31594.1 MAG: succinyldiaminopimelate aminotransferase [Sphingobacteriales bacterium 46-32]